MTANEARASASAWLLTAVTMLGAGCAAEPGGCIEGESRACACTDGRSSAQSCGPGRTFAPCVCAGGETDAGTVSSCGAGETLDSCLLDCIVANDFGPCRPDGTCAVSRTTSDGVRCRSATVATVNEAIAAGELDLDCASCFAQVPDCVVAVCGRCSDSDCICGVCQCDRGCTSRFEACTGLPPYLDCAAARRSC